MFNNLPIRTARCLISITVKRILILVIILLSACSEQTPDLISIKGLEHVLTHLNRTNIDEYLLKRGYSFKQQYVEPEDQFYFPKPLRHLYQNDSTTAIAVAYMGLRAFEIRIGTNDPNVYLKLKTEASHEGFVMKNTSDQAEVTMMHYVLPEKKLNISFEQRSAQYKHKYIIIFSDDNIGNKAADSVMHRNSVGDSSYSPQTDSVSTTPIRRDTTTHPLVKEAFVGSVKAYNFSTHLLYPSDDGEKLDSIHVSVNGVITAVNYDNNVFRVKTTDGEPLDIQFYPGDASSATSSDLRLALKPGNRIKSICARAGAATLDLCSAKIYVSPANK